MPEPQTLERRRESLSKEDIAEIVSRLTGLEDQIGECSKRINVRIDERMSEHSAIREMQAKVEAVTFGVEELKGIVKGAIGNGDRRLKDHDQEIEQLSLRINGVENAVKEIKAEIAQLEHNMATMSLDLKHVGLSTQDLPKRLNNIESRLDIVIDHIMKIDKSPAIPQKQDKGSKIAESLRMVPNYAWILIGLGIVAGLTFLLTGDASLIDRLGVSK